MYDNIPDDDQPYRKPLDPDYNGGIAPPAPAPRYDYNAGSPPDQPLSSSEHGWVWEGPKEQSWNPELGQWDRGVWQERKNEGLGYNPTPATPSPQPTSQPGGNTNQPAFQPPAAMAPQQAAAPAGVRTPPITDEVTKILMARLNELKNPGDVQSDPIYQNAVRAYQVQALRSADRQRKALAERSAASGTRASGGFNVGVRGINERAGENAAQYTSGLALDRLTAREQQLTQAIQMARSVGQDDIANQLEVQRLQLQAELGRGDLALRGELGRGQLGLGQDNLGFNYADLIARMNRDAVLAGLGGGG
jgi:hypothetical protein